MTSFTIRRKEKARMKISQKAKRVLISTLVGIAVGVPCAYGLISLNVLPFTTVNVVWALLNRGVMGFVIGVSGLRVHWAWNGIVLGLIVGSVFSYSLFMTVGPQLLPMANAIVNGLFGLIIEFFTTLVFKQRASVEIPAGAEPKPA